MHLKSERERLVRKISIINYQKLMEFIPTARPSCAHTLYLTIVPYIYSRNRCGYSYSGSKIVANGHKWDSVDDIFNMIFF